MLPPSIAQRPRRASRKKTTAFSLVEVVTALGIVSFGLVSMMGLLVAGIGTFREAVNATTEAQIAQQLANKMSLADYSAIVTNSEKVYHFTQEGLPVQNAGEAIYSAKVSAPTKLLVPGATSDGVSNTSTVVISIWSKTSPESTNAIPLQIANNGS
ncbi:MAG: hypothetical protein BGO12_00785 [Verrucomicrobia bacterium 61-8]|nr:Verru_Chthon cassette protein B [Verrucomicrobiota bacterium]OJV04309.1 MAG: hypothetical protein BGO12_00785 [Verrucomicrobia bacterium 61-8]